MVYGRRAVGRFSPAIPRIESSRVARGAVERIRRVRDERCGVLRIRMVEQSLQVWVFYAKIFGLIMPHDVLNFD